MEPDGYDCDLSLADFFYHIVGDKSTFSEELENLFVCYTLTRGLRIASTSPRRPSLPLEIILCIIRYAGFISVNPDPALMLDTSLLPCKHPHLFCGGYTTPDLTRVHLTAMARIRLAYEPGILSPEFPVSAQGLIDTFVTRFDACLTEGLRVQLTLGPTFQQWGFDTSPMFY
jgi:hypothetical protein